MFTVINKYGKCVVSDIGPVFGAVFHVACARVLWNVTFQTFIQSPFSKSAFSEIHWLWGSSSFWKCSKLHVDNTNPEKNYKNVFSCWDNSIWIGCIKLSPLRGEYLSSPVNVLTNSLKILNSTNIDLFQLNYVHSA